MNPFAERSKGEIRVRENYSAKFTPQIRLGGFGCGNYLAGDQQRYRTTLWQSLNGTEKR